MHRTALARKHRPRRFSELVGQDHVASTLRAAVEGNRAGHAYLFCGPRGVGKTTAARVLAMALNCPGSEGGEPCGTCESCDRIWSGKASLDVVEIDAASHRGVDDARDLRERAMYAPTSERRYKVYIIDEAHMLTREAWNTLLKILEEPPPRVIFAFATTEPQKIEQSAAPVLSRCQRFDFRRVSVPDILGRLEIVLEREGVKAEEGALLSIARRAGGGVRDALSLLDQVLSFAGEEVKGEDVGRMLGLVDEDRYLQLFEILARGDRAAVFPFVQRLLDAGFDPAEFVRGLGDALRALLVLRADPEGASLDLLPESRDRFAAAAAPFQEVDLLRHLMAVSDFETSGRFRRSSQQRIQLEVLLLRLASMDSAVELRELLAAAGGAAEGAMPASSRSGGRPGGGPAGRPPGSVAGAGGGPRGARASGASQRPPGVDVSRGGRTGAARRAPESGAAGAQPGSKRPASSPEGKAAAEAAGGFPGSGPPAEDRRAGGEASPLLLAWRGALSEVRGLRGQAVALRGARVAGFEDGVLRLRVPEGLASDLQAFLEDPTRSADLRERLARRLETDPGRLSFAVNADGEMKRLTAEEVRARRLSELVAMDPRLREAVEVLDLTLKE